MELTPPAPRGVRALGLLIPVDNQTECYNGMVTTCFPPTAAVFVPVGFLLTRAIEDPVPDEDKQSNYESLLACVSDAMPCEPWAAAGETKA